MTTMSQAEKAARLNRSLTICLFRVASLMLFGLGLAYWVRLVGVHEGALWRFDLMPVPWKMAACSLAVLYPVAGVGLWMTVSWGAVMWTFVAAIEGLMHFGFPRLFGGADVFMFLNLLGLGMLLVLRLIGWWEGRQRLRRAG